MNAVNVMQLLGADLLHRSLVGPEPGDLGAGQAVAYGLELGRICAPLLAQRWEEGWDRSLADWREQLGIRERVAHSPFHSPC